MTLPPPLAPANPGHLGHETEVPALAPLPRVFFSLNSPVPVQVCQVPAWLIKLCTGPLSLQQQGCKSESARETDAAFSSFAALFSPLWGVFDLFCLRENRIGLLTTASATAPAQLISSLPFPPKKLFSAPYHLKGCQVGGFLP